MKKSLIIGIFFLILAIGLTIYSEIKEKNIKYTNINEITNVGSKLEGVYVKLDATYVAGSITGNDNYRYYVIFGDGVQYIVYINNDKANEINKYLLDNPDDSYEIVGITKLIPSTMEENGKKFVKEWLDHTHNHESEEVEEGHTHDITTDEFYHYFGYVYIDTTIYESITNKIIIYVTGITGILSLAFYFNTKYHLL